MFLYVVHALACQVVPQSAPSECPLLRPHEKAQAILQKKETIAVLVAFIIVIGAAAALRLPQLELRPVHGDEANQAVKTGMLFETGEYRYDPHEHHGPTLYYLALPVLWSSGAESFADTTITQYRLIAVFFGLLTILLLWPLRDALGSGPMLWAALIMAVSHAMTYYSRYYIQEMLLVCFTQAALAAGWRLWRNPRVGWAIALGISLGLVHATKETSALIAMSALAAVALTGAYARLRDGARLAAQFQALYNGGALIYAAIACVATLAVSITLFSSFFTNLRGPLDSLLTYIHYLPRAEGEGSTALHNQPWYYYLSLLAYTSRQAGPRWSEAFTLALAAVGTLAVLWPRAKHDAREDGHDPARRALLFKRFLVFYTIIATLLYAIIPYKTPWNLLVFYHGMALLAGVGANAIVRLGRWRVIQVALSLALLAGAAHLARQSYQGNFIYHADARNPYVYAHPATALHRLTTRIEEIAAIADEGDALHINLIRPDGDYWPLPWYLRRYTRVGWWHNMPEQPDAAIILAAPQLYDILQEQLRDDYFIEFHALRPGILLHTYIRQDLWDAFIQTRR